MLSRRLLRVKVMQTFMQCLLQDNLNLKDAQPELQKSVESAHELYHYILLLPIALRRMAVKKIDIGQNKINPTQEELNPNMKFAENKFILQLEENERLMDYCEATGISWDLYDDALRTLFNKLIASESYIQYMSNADSSFEADRQFVLHYILKELPKYDFFFDVLEEMSIYWNDEAEYVLSIAGKTMKEFDGQNGRDVKLLPMYKEEEDKEFTEKLLRKTFALYREGFELIRKNAVRWDAERVNNMDVVLIIMSMAEMVTFSEIPVKVTLNEYIEISKYYSGEKSHQFINGILEKIVKQLAEEKRILSTQLM